jgi:hypothetical protein
LQEEDTYKEQKRKKLKKSNPDEVKKQNKEEVLITNNISDVCETIDQVFQSKEFFS